MTKVSKSVLKAKMFEYFRELEEKGGELIVTDFGEPVLQITPLRKKETSRELFKDLVGKAKLPRAAVLEDTSHEWKEK